MYIYIYIYEEHNLKSKLAMPPFLIYFWISACSYIAILTLQNKLLFSLVIVCITLSEKVAKLFQRS